MQLAEDANYEQGFFFLWYLAKFCHKYLCGNEEMKKNLRDALSGVPGGARMAELLSPQYLLGATGTTVAGYIISAVPWLTLASAPMISGVVVLIGTIGIDIFCGWAGDRLKKPHPYQAERDR